MGWPPQVGEFLPRASEAYGVREKLAQYCLNPEHPVGGPKAAGFALILGITLDSIDHLATEIREGVQRQPVAIVTDNEPYGVKCVVDIPIAGIGSYSGRTVKVRTVWELAAPPLPPRLISAFPKG